MFTRVLKTFAPAALAVAGYAGLVAAGVPGLGSTHAFAGAVVIAVALSQLVTRPWRSAAGWRRHARIAAESVAVALPAYVTGWGPALTVGFVFTASDQIRKDGVRAGRLVLLWSGVAVAGAHGLLLAGVLPSTLSHAQATGLVALSWLGTAAAVNHIAVMAEAKERSEVTLAARERRYRALVQNASDGVAVFDRHGRLQDVSPGAGRLLGRDAAELEGVDAFTLLHPEDVERAGAAAEPMLRGDTDRMRVDLRVRHASGEWRWLEIVGTDLRRDEAVSGVVANFRDVTERKAEEADLTHRAHHDELTGLANRTAFRAHLDEAVERSRRLADHHVAVLFVDLDGFKDVNDVLGHDVGDAVLSEIGERLRRAVRPGDVVARYGGDEFTVLVEGQFSEVEVREIGSRLVATAESPIVHPTGVVTLSASVGLAWNGGPDSDGSRLLRAADAAMYRAKSHGGGRIDIAPHDVEPGDIRTAADLERDLRRGLDAGEIELHVQPVVHLVSGAATGFEALARWRHPGRGLVMPHDFIPVAEESDLIVALDAQMLRRACAWAAHRESELGIDPCVVSVNLSPRWLHRVRAAEEILDVIAAAKRATGVVQVEITERRILRVDAQLADTLEILRAAGVRVAVDDFGTGYSSIEHLRCLPVDVVKLDQSFVSGVDTNARDRAIVRSLVALAHDLGLEVTAEGVERDEQLLALQELGCDHGQGFLFARPALAADVIALDQPGFLRR